MSPSEVARLRRIARDSQIVLKALERLEDDIAKSYGRPAMPILPNMGAITQLLHQYKQRAEVRLKEAGFDLKRKRKPRTLAEVFAGETPDPAIPADAITNL